MKGFIYIIRSHQTDEVYYGSTTQMLCKRMAKHREAYRYWLDGKRKYTETSSNIIQYDDAYIELIETVEFQDKKELHAREGYYIRENKCVNRCVMGRTKEVWYQDNKEAIAEKCKKYNEEHKEHIKELHKEYYQVNKEILAEKHLIRQREYRKANKELVNEQQRKYRASKKSQPNL